jgi:hypothetical protein
MENGHRLRLYQRPKTKEEFIQELVKQMDLNIVSKVASPPIPTAL